MRTWVIAIGIVLSTVASASAQYNYFVTGYVYMQTCATMRVEMGKEWTFTRTPASNSLYVSEMVSFPAELSANSQANWFLYGDASCCSQQQDNCGPSGRTRLESTSPSCFTLLISYNGWQIRWFFTKIQIPTVTSAVCDRVTVEDPRGQCGANIVSVWAVTDKLHPTTADWKSIGDVGIVTVDAVAAAGLNPYGELYVSYRYESLTLMYSDYAEKIPINFGHAPPQATVNLTHKFCAGSSGIKLTSTVAVLPIVLLSVRKDLGNGAWDYNAVPERPVAGNALENLSFSLPPGVYELNMQNAGGADGDNCTTIIPFEITGRAPSVEIDAFVEDEKCFGAAGTGSITLTPGGAEITPPYTYAWTHDATLHDKDLTALPGDITYHVTVTDARGCFGQKDIPVNEPDPISITEAYVSSSYNGADVSCPANTVGVQNDGAVHLQAGGGTGTLLYRLLGDVYSTAFQSSSDFTGLRADNYQVLVKDDHDCTVVHSSTVPVMAPPDITHTRLDITPLRCANIREGAIIIVGAAGGTGALQYALNGGTYQSSNTFGGQDAGTYTVSIADRNGCRRDIVDKIDAPSLLKIESITKQPESCLNKNDGAITVVASGGTGAIQYALTDEPSAYKAVGQFTGLPATTYTIYIRDGNNCRLSTPDELRRKDPLAGPIAVTQRVRCNGESNGILTLTASGGTAPYHYTWSANAGQATTAVVGNLAGGDYTVTIRDDKGCEDTFRQTMPQPDILQLTTEFSRYDGYGVRCAGSTDGAIYLGVKGGNIPYQYDWGADGTTQDLENKPAGMYKVVVTDSRGCQAVRDRLELTAPPVLQLTTGVIRNISCKGEADGRVPLLATGGTGAYRYSSDGLTWGDAPLIEGLKAQAYTFYVEDKNKCTAHVPATLTEPLKALTLEIASLTATVCGQANGSASVKADGGTGAYAYTWYNGTTVISRTDAAAALRSGTYPVVVHDDNACEAIVKAIINDSNGPVVTQEALVGLTCHNSNDGLIRIAVDAKGQPYTVQWDMERESGLEVTHVTRGYHWVEVVDAKDCLVRMEFDVLAPQPVTITQTTIAPTCKGDRDGKIEVAGHGGNIGGYTYTWKDIGETIPLREGLGEGSYAVVVSDVKDCQAEATIELSDPAAFTVNAGGDRTICTGQRVTVNVQNDAIDTYQWTSSTGFTSSAPVVELREPGSYTVSVVSVRGCKANDSFTIQTSTEVLKADFLMAAHGLTGDTIVVVEISWPEPESIEWTVPEGAALIQQEGAYGGIVFADPGEYTILLNTALGECTATLAKNISIQSNDDSNGGREGSSLIAGFDVYPNPNDGQFTVAIALRRTDAVAHIRMMNVTGDRRVWDVELLGTGEYRYNGNPLPAGVYLVLLEAENEQRIKRIVVK